MSQSHVTRAEEPSVINTLFLVTPVLHCFLNITFNATTQQHQLRQYLPIYILTIHMYMYSLLQYLDIYISSIIILYLQRTWVEVDWRFSALKTCIDFEAGLSTYGDQHSDGYRCWSFICRIFSDVDSESWQLIYPECNSNEEVETVVTNYQQISGLRHPLYLLFVLSW